MLELSDYECARLNEITGIPNAAYTLPCESYTKGYGVKLRAEQQTIGKRLLNFSEEGRKLRLLKKARGKATLTKDEISMLKSLLSIGKVPISQYFASMRLRRSKFGKKRKLEYQWLLLKLEAHIYGNRITFNCFQGLTGGYTGYREFFSPC